MPFVNKSEFVDRVAARVAVERAGVEEVIDATLLAVQAALVEGDEVVLPGFGRFAVTVRAERAGRNPRTGDAMVIPASQYPRFTPGTTFRAAVRAADQRNSQGATVQAVATVAPTSQKTQEAGEMSKKKKKDKKGKKGKKK